MSQAHRHSRGFRPIRKAASVFRMSGSTLMRLDPDGLRYNATILVWAHWFVVAFSLVQLAYRPAGWPERHVVYAPLFLLLVAFNAMTHSPAGDEKDYHMALDSRVCGYGYNDGLGRHGDRGRDSTTTSCTCCTTPRWPGTWSSGAMARITATGRTRTGACKRRRA